MTNTATTAIVNMDQWSSQASEAFNPLSFDYYHKGPEENFKAEISSTKFNRIQLSRVSSNALKVVRSKSNISQACTPQYLVKFQLDGESFVEHRNREAHLRPGDFVICNSNDPYQLHFPDHYSQAVLTIPHSVMDSMHGNADDFLGVRMAGSSPMTGLVSQFVASLVSRIDQLNPKIVNHLEANVLDLLVTALNSEHMVETQSAPDQHLKQVKRFIHLHLKDLRLNPDFIAQAEGISKRYLHMLFKEEGSSVSRYILQLRLDACHESLSSKQMQHLSATDIALHWGFGDISHFHRCFKSRYDITPRQFRLQSQTLKI